MKQALFFAPLPPCAGLTALHITLHFCLFLFALLPGTGLAQPAVDSAAVVKQVDSLIQVSRGLTDKRDFDKALELNKVAEQLVLEQLGRETAAYGNVCANRGRSLHKQKDYPGAEKWWLESKNIRERLLGKEHADYGRSILNLANVYSDMSNHGQAESLYLEAKTLWEKTIGKESNDYTVTVNNLANLYSRMGKFQKAEPLYLEIKVTQEKVLGKEHLAYTRTLNSLAALYSEMGDYEKAGPLYIEATLIQEKVLGKEHPNYANTLNNLAVLNVNLGDYEKAESLHLEAKAIRAKVLGKEHPQYAQSLHNLAVVYYTKGDYDQAMSLNLEAKTIREKVLGKEHPDYTKTMNNLALIHRAIGAYDKAISLYLQTTAIQEKVLGKEHPDYAHSLNNLASLYRAKGEYDKAVFLHLEAKTIREKVLGKEHPDYAHSLNNLANAYYAKGEYDKVLPLHLEAKAIREKVLGKEHPDYALSLNDLASIYADKSEYDKALPLYLEAKATRERALGKEHPDYAETLHCLAVAYSNKSDRVSAATYFFSSNTATKSLIQKSARYFSEKEMIQYQALIEERFDALLRFTQTYPADSLLFAAYDNALFLNNALLFNAIAREKGIAQADSSTRDMHAEWKSCHFQLSKQYALPIDERDSARIARLEDRANEYEKELVRRSPTFVESQRVANWQEVQQNLKPGEAAIEFVHYRLHHEKETDNPESSGYAALILRPLPAGDLSKEGGWLQPRMVPLFDERDIQPLLAAANTAAAAGQLYASRGSKKSENATRGAGGDIGQGIVIPGPKTTSLYQLIWAPMDSLLRGTTKVYYAPSGLIHRLNIDAIAVPGADQTLADRYALVQLGSTRSLAIGTKARQLVVQDGSAAATAKTATLFGGLRYEAKTPAAEVPDSSQQTQPAYDIAALRSALGGRAGDAWSYLPGTEKEVKNAAETLGKAGYSVHTLGGHDGSEAAFKMLGKNGIPAPNVLHIATHGFFFPDPKDTTRADSPSVGGGRGEVVFKTSGNPLLRSGLVLAGANPAWAGSKTPDGQEDGILTAYEISQMNLGGTELVVLSACETGLGDVEDNEGVYGLKRAFKIAGAKYLIMSLWQVPDQQTQELMSAFYKNWLERQMTVPAAFAAAQRAMRGRYGDPFFWAGFVLVE